MARRLVERGVRMVQIFYGNFQPWDDHNDILNHRKLAFGADRPIAALGAEGAGGKGAGQRRSADVVDCGRGAGDGTVARLHRGAVITDYGHRRQPRFHGRVTGRHGERGRHGGAADDRVERRFHACRRRGGDGAV